MGEEAGEWKRKEAPLMTRWSDQVTSSSTPHPHHPRPLLERDAWLNLNGVWELAVVEGRDVPATFPLAVMVPFCVESALSGVMEAVALSHSLVYRRTFTLPPSWASTNILLHFEAVDYSSQVLVNGVLAGKHTGGYDAFTLDITGLVVEGEQEIVVIVEDPTETQLIPVGKQYAGSGDFPGRFIFYTPTSGIWQTVWVESVPEEHITGILVTPQIERGEVDVKVDRTGAGTVTVTMWDGEGEQVGEVTGEEKVVVVPVARPRLWSPKDPHLYTLKVRLSSGDLVSSYCGLRTVRLGRRGEAHWVELNGELLDFQAGPLDQGYWPDGLLTPPSEEAIRWDLERLKEMGFNMVRKHIKIEASRWYYWADRLGLLVWQDLPSISPKWNAEIKEDTGAQANFRRESSRWMAQLAGHPSIIHWVVFNEAWGQFNTREVAEEVMRRDPSRLVTAASGWDDCEVGHVRDLHIYPGPSEGGQVVRSASRLVVLGEMWGKSLVPWGHCWFGDDWARKHAAQEHVAEVKGAAQFIEAYQKVVEELKELKGEGYAAAVFTQLTDVEGELNGYFSYDREVAKVDLATLAELHRALRED